MKRFKVKSELNAGMLMLLSALMVTLYYLFGMGTQPEPVRMVFAGSYLAGILTCIDYEVKEK